MGQADETKIEGASAQGIDLPTYGNGEHLRRECACDSREEEEAERPLSKNIQSAWCRHFYGVITAYVPGEAAAGYKFSSALPVQVLHAMAPMLEPLLAAGEAQPLGWREEVADFEAAAGPHGALWPGGPPAAVNRGAGPALDFCLLVTQRRHRDDTAVTADGVVARHWLTIAQAFAGPPGAGREPARA